MRSIRCCNLVVVIPLLIFLMSSCSNGLHIEKRHYRNGFYIDGNRQSLTTQVAEPPALQPRGKTNALPENPELQRELQDCGPQCEAEAVSKDSVITNPEENICAPADTSGKKGKFIDRFRYKGPPEAKKAMTIHRVGLIFILVSVAGILLGLTPWYFLGYGALLMLPGIVLEIIAIVCASEGIGEFRTTDSEKSEYFRKVRRRAIWGLAILGIGYLIFMAGILFVMLFLNGY
jgi:hypothetical protein